MQIAVTVDYFVWTGELKVKAAHTKRKRNYRERKIETKYFSQLSRAKDRKISL